MAAKWAIAVTAAVIACCWTSGVFTVKLLQRCDYNKPYLLTYLHELGVTAVSIPLAACGGAQLWPRCRQLGLRALGLGLLAFGANICFMVALVLTTASSAMTLEQLTPVCIAGLSYVFLKETYGICQILWLGVAIAGSVLTARSDVQACHEGHCSGSMPLLGDLLVVVTCVTAALYMVCFKLMFAEGCSWQVLFTYFMVKGMSVAVVGGLALPFLPSSQLGLPQDECGWGYLGINMVANMAFNLSLAWGMLVVSPLACRLFVLLGLPASLVLDAMLGVAVHFQRVLGVALVTCGVAGFEAYARAAPRSESRESSECREEELSGVESESTTSVTSDHRQGAVSGHRRGSQLCLLGAIAVCTAGFLAAAQ
ncbi:unnamed protein product [Effrenium voratum]|nr:unnamed protein product [Effrenium voratum]